MELPVNDTIVAVSTPHGVGGIAVIRVSGKDAGAIVSECWRGAAVSEMKSHSAHFGRMVYDSGEVLDEVVLTIFRTPNSFTGEDVVEISCHGSKWIQREIVNLLVAKGARPANPGEFTQRAFMNGRIDLAKAEGIADLIAASSKASQRLAMQQVGGTFSTRLNELRDKLIELASLLELELDFSEEDVEFADRTRLKNLCGDIREEMTRLAHSYASGRVLKEGVPVVIAGAPNAGKSTLLNYLLGEDKAIVSDIPGTTRDTIEDSIEIDGILYRFIDTAGLRKTNDVVEKIGIERTEKRIGEASIILWLIDPSDTDVALRLQEIDNRISELKDVCNIKVLTKSDLTPDDIGKTVAESIGVDDGKIMKCDAGSLERGLTISLNTRENDALSDDAEFVSISSKTGDGIEHLIKRMKGYVESRLEGENDVIVTNSRHYYELMQGLEALDRVDSGLTSGGSIVFISQDLREVLSHLGSITGSITTPDLLSSIFQHFCIGK